MALIEIDPGFQKLIPQLSSEEFAQLEKNILRDGIRDAVRRWGTILLDGHNRYRICQNHQLHCPTTQIELDSREAALVWIEENQLGRRNLTDDQRAIVAARLAKRRGEANRKAAASAAGQASGKARNKSHVVNDAFTTLAKKTNETPKERTIEKAAKDAKVPLRKVRAAQKVVNASPELADKVLNSEMPLAKALREIKACKPADCKEEGSILLLAIAKLAKRADDLPNGLTNCSADTLSQLEKIQEKINRLIADAKYILRVETEQGQRIRVSSRPRVASALKPWTAGFLPQPKRKADKAICPKERETGVPVDMAQDSDEVKQWHQRKEKAKDEVRKRQLTGVAGAPPLLLNGHSLPKETVAAI